MLGVIFYSLFIVLGTMYAGVIFRGKSVYFRLWTGGIIGSVILMSGIIPLALMFGFTRVAHIILALIFAGVYFIIGKRPDLHIGRPNRAAAVTVGTFTLLMCVLLTNHIMVPADGGIASGQSTYGDLAMHMGFVTSIAEQGIFPPQYNLLAGSRLCYPFLFDSLSSSLYLFGSDLRTAILYPSFVFSFLNVSGFYFLAKKLTKSSGCAVLATVLFFLGGGFGFAYFFDGAKENAGNFTRMFTEFYNTPTNYNEYNIRWANAICDMLIPQRTTMAGWGVLFFALWLLADALEHEKTAAYLALGITAGCMPMIHTHSFLALGIVSASCFFAFLPRCGDKKRFVKNWCIYGAVTAALAAGQLSYWTFYQSAGNDAFIRIALGWVNKSDPTVWFWLKNWGLAAVLAVPAYLCADSFMKRFCISGAVIFAIANTVIFQPNDYDNNKLLFVAYMMVIILISDYLLMLYRRLKYLRGTKLIACGMIFTLVFSGALSVIREYISGGQYKTFTDADIEFAEFVKSDTPTDAVFASGNQHLNPVCALAGRNIYVGSEIYVYFHGLEKEMNRRYKVIKEIYEGENPAETAKEYGIDYILVTDSEREDFDINSEGLAALDTVYCRDGIELYRIKY